MTDQPTAPATELTATLVIGRSYSRCGHCGENTLPQDTHHVDICGWTPEPGGGCGARYVAMRSDYGGTGEELRAMRPDLPIEDEQTDQPATDPSDAELIEHARTVGMVEPEKAPAFVEAYRAHVEEQSGSHGAQQVPTLADVEEQRRAAEKPPTTGDLFTDAAIRSGALLAGADVIENLPQDYECDPGRGDAVKVLRRLAAFHTNAEQPTGITWETRAEHAVRLYATTAIERDDAQAEAAKLRERLAEVAEGWRQADARTDREHALAELEKQKPGIADHLAAEHPDTIESLLDELADDIPNRRARAIAADYLARYTRLLVAEARTRQSERNTEMRAEGYRGRVAWTSGMREVSALLDVRADAIAKAGR